jgi:hypothetical protein
MVLTLKKWHGSWLKRPVGWALTENCCCTCLRPDCCSMMIANTRFTNLLVQVTGETCSPYSWSGILMGGSPWTGSTGFGADTVTVWCESADDPAKTILRIVYELVISDTCALHFDSDWFEVDCFPLDVTVDFDSEVGAVPPGNACCGHMSIRITEPPCSSSIFCGCEFDSYCVEKTLQATVIAVAPCPADEDHEKCCYKFRDGITVPITCNSGCTWTTGKVCLGGDEDCCFTLTLTGTQDNNRWCDWQLQVLDGDNELVWSGPPYAGIAEGMTISFGPITLPAGCCTGEVYIHITE